ncbi:type VII secretion-associated serine protease mycosin [Streptomyces sp. LBL]|uniref:S8 family serine peptidase n=1 Tax=Streptomyces sp. LBL TaxID=2940562 RepID=UPI0024767EA2|nr:S8 family serine peptidase [Streptomyces sp. LBL]MDH6624206.1 type VII secretion-associated serine protease mycosin [Streptomyces sp. LBL]
MTVTSPSGRLTAYFAGSAGRRVSTVCAALGAFAIVSSGLAPSAVAADVQSKQWYLDAMDAEGLWKISRGEGVKVAVLDSGVNPETSSLKGQVLADEVPHTVSYKATNDYDGHGTSMAELIAGTGDGDGLQGLAPGAKIIPYRVVTSSLKNSADKKKTPEVADAITAAADSDAQIISMSFGSDIIDFDVEKAVKYAESKGKLMFAATGNDAETKNFIGYPAAFPYVVGVAAADKSGKVASYSEHGNYVDLAAPGVNVPLWCDATFQSYCPKSGGTSAATAITSASAALIWSAHPNWTANQVLRSLIDTANRDWPKDKPSNYLGYGLIRPKRVVTNSNINPGPPNSDPLSYENGTGVTGVTTSPSVSAPPSSPAPKNISGGATPAAVSSSNSSDNNTQLYVILGAVLVVAIGGGAFAVARKRRTA